MANILVSNIRRLYRNFFQKNKKTIFKESALAHKYLDNLSGIEIGGSAHNPFGLDTINVDRFSSMKTIFKDEEEKLCGEKLKVDVKADGDNLPFEDKSYDFVISSHVIEHFFDPIKALREWERVAKKYIFIISPHKERTFDKNRPISTIKELQDRHDGKIPFDDGYKHHNVWDTQSFLELCKYLDFNVIEYMDVDDKAGNGFTVVIKLYN